VTGRDFRTPTDAAPTRQLRHARVAVALCFFLNAVLYANLVPRLPEVKADLGLSNSSLGAALAALPSGRCWPVSRRRPSSAASAPPA
jgi:hypothetical protein